MTNESLKKTISDHMKTLPRDVQDAINASSWERKVLTIGRRHGLHVDQLEILQTELSLAVLGLADREEFVQETMREARIDRQSMEKIVKDINEEIFEKIRNYLKQTRQHNYEVERENNGFVEEEKLQEYEEETLRRHGFSFNLDEEQVVPQKKETVISLLEKKDDQTISKPSLSSPLRLVKTKDTPISFEDVLKTNVNTTDQNVEILKTEEDINSKNEGISVVAQEDQNLPGSDLDPDTLASSKTQANQSLIQGGQKIFYQKNDPYREPIL